MQSTSTTRAGRLRCTLAVVCVLAVLVVGGVQVAHWDSDRATDHAAVQKARSTDGLCPICYSVPVGHGATASTANPVCLEFTSAVAILAQQQDGILPEFHLHIRPPPALV